MYSIVITDGKIINVNATGVVWSEKPRTIQFVHNSATVAIVNMDNIVGWIKTDYKAESEEKVRRNNE